MPLWWQLFVSLLTGLLLWLALFPEELPALFRSEQIVLRFNNDLAENLLLQLGE